MKRIPLLLVVVACLVGVTVLVWPPQRSTGPKPLLCYVGGTMEPVFRALTAAYEKKTGRRVEISTADSGELLAKIQMRLEGDLYVAHDPFMDIAMGRGLGVNAWCLGELCPVIVVAKGNPKHITSLKDFYRDDVKVFLTDYHHSTLGSLLPLIFRKAGLDFDELNRRKKIPTHRAGSWAANQVILKAADAALVWQAVAHLRRKDLDAIEITDALPVPDVDTITSATGKVYIATPVKVDIVALANSRRPRDARQFAAFVASDAGRKLFKEYGFKVTSQFGARAYANGVRVPLPPYVAEPADTAPRTRPAATRAADADGTS